MSTMFSVKRGNFYLDVLVQPDKVRERRPFVQVSYNKYAGPSRLIESALRMYDGNWGSHTLFARAELSHEDKTFSVSYGLNLAVDKLTRQIAGEVRAYIREAVYKTNVELQSLANATSRSKKRFVKRHEKHADMQTVLNIVDIDPIKLKEVIYLEGVQF